MGQSYSSKLSQQIKLAKSFINVPKIFIRHGAFINHEKFLWQIMTRNIFFDTH